jgi:hypothetical protein
MSSRTILLIPTPLKGFHGTVMSDLTKYQKALSPTDTAALEEGKCLLLSMLEKKDESRTGMSVKTSTAPEISTTDKTSNTDKTSTSTQTSNTDKTSTTPDTSTSTQTSATFDKYESRTDTRLKDAATKASLKRDRVEAACVPWSDFVSFNAVEELIRTIPLYPPNSEDCIKFKDILENEYGRKGKDTPAQISKLAHMESLLRKLAVTSCKDTRIENLDDMIIVVDILPDERLADGSTRVERMIRPNRNFNVNDPLFFCLAFREMQRSHLSYPSNKNSPPHGTKGMSEMFSAVGLGPVTDARAHKVYLKQYRGPASTDPDKIHPDIAYKKQKFPAMNQPLVTAGSKSRETDGFYFRRYEYTDERVVTSLRRYKNNYGPGVTTAPVPVAPARVPGDVAPAWEGRAAFFKNNPPPS